MSLDRHEADRRRFARLLGLDEADGFGLPIGSRSERNRADRRIRDEESLRNRDG